MSPEELIETAVKPAYFYLPDEMNSPLATRQLVAIALQESGLRHRIQQDGDDDPFDHAVGWWQFERIGVAGVVYHHATEDVARGLIAARGKLSGDDLYKALACDDILAAGMARLLLWQYPGPLPHGQDEGWRQYIEQWDPGKPHYERWLGNWELASAAIGV